MLIEESYNSYFEQQIVDTSANDCDNAFAYLPDLGSYAIVVYDFKKDKSYRVKHNYFHFDPLQGDLTVGGVSVQIDNQKLIINDLF